MLKRLVLSFYCDDDGILFLSLVFVIFSSFSLDFPGGGGGGGGGGLPLPEVDLEIVSIRIFLSEGGIRKEAAVEIVLLQGLEQEVGLGSTEVHALLYILGKVGGPERWESK